MKHSLKKNRKQSKPPTVPTELDWGEYGLDLDQNHAHSVFAGRSNEEMQSCFRQNTIGLTDDLRWMPEVPFRYYIIGFRDFVLAKDFDFLDGSDAANCFLGLVLEKLERNPRLIVPVMSKLLPAVEYVAQNQSLFQAEESNYGKFPGEIVAYQSAVCAIRVP
jgi:hypothetical protein